MEFEVPMESQAKVDQQDTPKDQPTQAPSQPDFKSSKHKVKIEDQELEVDYDELLNGYQLSKASRRKFEEASNLRKQVDELIDTFGKGDLDLLKEFVPKDKLAKFAYDYLQKQVEWEEMPEERRRLIEMERELNNYKTKEEQKEHEERKKISQQQYAQAERWLEDSLLESFDKLRNKYGNIPITADMIQDIALSLWSHEISKDDGEDSELPDIDSFSEKTLSKWTNRNKQYVSSLSVDELKNILTKEQLRSLRQMDLDAALAQAPRARKSNSEQASSGNKSKKVGVDEYFDNLTKKFGGR